MGNKIKKIYVGTHQVRPAQEPPFTPGANTLAYYPLTGDANDYSGNGYNAKWYDKYGSEASSDYYTLSSGHEVADFDKSDFRMIRCTSLTTAPKTVSFWLKFNSTSPDNGQDWRQIIGQYTNETGIWQLRYGFWAGVTHAWVVNNQNSNYSMDTDRHHICLLLDGTTIYIYVDTVLTNTITGTTTGTSGGLWIGGNNYGDNGSYPRLLHGYMSDVILEDVLWNSTKMTNYYNASKGNYGL